MRSLVLLVATVLLVMAISPATVSSAGWTPVGNVHQQVIQQVGRFCVIVYDLTSRANLTYVDVVNGSTEQAVGGGTNYQLVVIAARPERSSAQYQCLVWGVPGSRFSTWKLHRFKMI